MLAKRTYKNQITIPKEILKDFQEVDYFDVSAKEGQIILRPVSVKPSGEHLSMVRDKIQSLGITEKDISDAIQWARRPPSKD